MNRKILLIMIMMALSSNAFSDSNIAPSRASQIRTDTSSFSKNLSSSDSTVQKALNTLDQELGGASLWVSGNVGINTTNNVGIGSSNPGQALDVGGTVRATAFVVGSGGFTSTGALTGLNQYIGANISIGTSSAPTQALDVKGTVQAIGFINSGATASTPAIFDSSKKIISGSYSGNTTTLATTNTISGSGNVCADGSGNLTTTGCSSGGSSNWIYSSSGNVGLSTTSNVGIGTTFVGSSALAVMGGNVAIGTWVPNALLDVNRILNVTTAGNVSINHTSPTHLFEVYTAGGSAPALTVSSSSISNINNDPSFNLSDTNLSFNNNGTASIVNVGNSTNPNIKITGGAATNAFIELRTTSSGSGSGDYVKITGGNNGGTEIARFFGSGNVGIGTTIDNAGLIQLKHNSSAQGEVACIGLNSTGTCLGYCSGTITDVGGSCSVCTCL